MKESHNFELAHLKKKKRRKNIWQFGDFWLSIFVIVLVTLGVFWL